MTANLRKPAKLTKKVKINTILVLHAKPIVFIFNRAKPLFNAHFDT